MLNKYFINFNFEIVYIWYFIFYFWKLLSNTQQQILSQSSEVDLLGSGGMFPQKFLKNMK